MKFYKKPSKRKIKNTLIEWLRLLSIGRWDDAKSKTYSQLSTASESERYLEDGIWQYLNPTEDQRLFSPPVSDPIKMRWDRSVLEVEVDDEEDEELIFVYIKLPLNGEWSDLRAQFILFQNSDGMWEMYFDQLLR